MRYHASSTKSCIISMMHSTILTASTDNRLQSLRGFYNLVSVRHRAWRTKMSLRSSNVWGFIDGTVRPIARPTRHQRQVYNGHKRVHAIKFQSAVERPGLFQARGHLSKCAIYGLDAYFP